MAVGIGLDGDADVEAWGVVFEVGGEVVGVYGVGDISGEEEAVGVGLSEGVRVVLGIGGREGFDDSGDGTGEEVAVGALPEEGADFLVVE